MTTQSKSSGMQVQIKRTEIPSPSLDDPGRIVVQTQYQVGELPPRFVYLAKKDWTAAKEAAMIKADVDKRMSTPGESISI